MGRLILPMSGDVYVDTQTMIYTVEKHPVYASLCRPLWEATVRKQIRVVSSELTLMETLVLPIRNQNILLEMAFEQFLLASDTTLLPITKDVLREAARLRATISGLKTPDAIHAATALINQCNLFITNDRGSMRVPGLNPAILDDVLAAP